MEEQQYFVQIREPADIRRGLLGSSKQIIQILQRYERIKAIRVKKLEKIARLRTLNKEINLLVAKMKKELPTPEFRVKAGKEDRGKRASKEQATKGDDLNKLESELRMLEEKLHRLG